MAGAHEIPGFSFTLDAAADWSVEATTGQYRFVTVDSAGRAAAPTANGSAIGVRQNTPPQYGATTVVTSGVTWVEAGEVIAPGEFVKTDAAGKAMDADTTGDIILGVCLTGAGADGELCTVLLSTPGHLAAVA